MNLSPIPSTSKTFALLREFISKINLKAKSPISCFDLARLEFTYAVSCAMHQTSPKQWQELTTLWVDDSGSVQAALVSEGEHQGEAFFLTGLDHVSEDVINQVITAGCLKMAQNQEDGTKELFLRIPTHLKNGSTLLSNQGFSLAPWKESVAEFPINQSNPAVDRAFNRPNYPPAGYTLLVGNSATPQLKGLCHSLAFGYGGEQIYEKRIVEGFTKLRTMPGYREDLDLLLLDSSGAPAAMMSFWFDPITKWGSLEPAGTVPAHRKKGLGQWLIQEGVRRLKPLGCTSIFCGSDQEFYLASGFRVVDSLEVWTKKC